MDIKEENIDEENQVKENQVKKNQVKENINSQKKEQDILIEESVASFLHKLKTRHRSCILSVKDLQYSENLA